MLPLKIVPLNSWMGTPPKWKSVVSRELPFGWTPSPEAVCRLHHISVPCLHLPIGRALSSQVRLMPSPCHNSETLERHLIRRHRQKVLISRLRSLGSPDPNEARHRALEAEDGAQFCTLCSLISFHDRTGRLTALSVAADVGTANTHDIVYSMTVSPQCSK